MPAILSALAWLFKRFKLGELASFVLKRAVFTKVVAIEIAMFAFMLTYFGALLYLATFLFGQLFDVVDSIKQVTNFKGNDVATTAFSVFSALGIFKAFWDVFNLYAPIFISLFLMLGAKIGIKLLEKLRYSISGLVKTFA